MPASKSESSSSSSSGSASSPLQTCTVSIAVSKLHLSSSVSESLHDCFDALSRFHTCTCTSFHVACTCIAAMPCTLCARAPGLSPSSSAAAFYSFLCNIAWRQHSCHPDATLRAEGKRQELSTCADLNSRFLTLPKTALDIAALESPGRLSCRLVYLHVRSSLYVQICASLRPREDFPVMLSTSMFAILYVYMYISISAHL
ncbi:hypothetical protein KP509_20G005300 [Ceratopteris richardii]|uniref:Uncharacterized protein n=1 Tax=Ceratopteris richardii TaxID=49495 RepID=A0A8T2SEQ6_CERRI|nr:hypothetical protein KP509_20G005300 [Ceratopteris richardii]